MIVFLERAFCQGAETRNRRLREYPVEHGVSRSLSVGLSGWDGSNGSNGRGGSITVAYDPQAKPYLAVLHLSNVGGPNPVFNEETVAPLW